MIRVDNLQFGYSKKRKLFNELSFEFREGHIYGLLGKNGTGKTTLLKIISGLLYPNKGECQVLGQNPIDRNPSLLKDVFLIPEDIYAPEVSIKDFVAANAAFYTKFDLGSFLAYIKEFEIGFNEKISSLSYGQKKKVLISFGLATNCSILILDEPTNGLDIPSKSQFRKIVASVATEERVIIISTHQVRDLDNLIDIVVILDEGCVALFESTDNIIEKLVFKTVDADMGKDALYGETSIRGFSGVFLNTKGEHSKLDMEALFNATLANKANIQKVFNNQ